MRSRLPDAVWLVTRIVLAVLTWRHYGNTQGDSEYFVQHLAGADLLHLGSVMPEYPVPAVLMLDLVRGCSDVTGIGMLGGLVLAMLVVDLVMYVALRRRGEPVAVWAWVIAVPAMGPTAFSRFDLVPGVLVGLALLHRRARTTLSGAVTALAVFVKVWPLLPAATAVVGDRSTRFLRGALPTAVLLIAVSWVTGGFARVFSPVTFQHDRGLQIESVAATPLIVARAFAPDRWKIGQSTFNALELTGPGVGVALHVAQVLTLTWGVLLVVLWWRLWRRRRAGADVDLAGPAVWIDLAGVSGFIAGSQVLSPQYLLWLAPIAVAGAALRPTPAHRAFVGVLLVVMALTTAEYPFLYDGINHTATGSSTPAATVCLAARNVLLLALVVAAFVRAWRSTSLTPCLDSQP